MCPTRARVLSVTIAFLLIVSGCAGLSGETEPEPTQTETTISPTETPQETQTQDTDSGDTTQTQDANSGDSTQAQGTESAENTPRQTATQTPERTSDDSELVTLESEVVRPDTGERITVGELRLYDATGDVVARRDLTDTPTPRFEDLPRGRSYTLEAVDTSYAPVRETLTVTESTNHTLTLDYGFQGAETFRFQYTAIRENPIINVSHMDVGFGEVAPNGDGMLGEWRAVEASLDINVSRDLYLHTHMKLNPAEIESQFDLPPALWVFINNKTYTKNPVESEWEKTDSYYLNEPDLNTVRAGLDLYNHTEREFVQSEELSGTVLPEELDGLEVDVYRITSTKLFNEDVTPETLYVLVDPETGQIVRWEADLLLENDRILTLISDYYNHGETIEITTDRFGIDGR